MVYDSNGKLRRLHVIEGHERQVEDASQMLGPEFDSSYVDLESLVRLYGRERVKRLGPEKLFAIYGPEFQEVFPEFFRDS